jgi:hypothetical protein
MNKIIFIADFFANEINGGGELNNEELINILSSKGHQIEKINSRICTLEFIKINKNNFFILGNFIQLHNSCLDFIKTTCRYVIYEHDHKYIMTRNPAFYKDYIAPKDQIINVDLYKNAKAIFCQSTFHKNIMLKNLSDVNVVNLSGNLWSEDVLNLLKQISKKEKTDNCAIMNSREWHKNTAGSIDYCNKKGLKYNLIDPCDYKQFLNKLSENKKLVFFPQTPETLSRITLECRMMNMSVVINDKIGASYEDWFKLKGEELINLMYKKRTLIPSIVEEYI